MASLSDTGHFTLAHKAYRACQLQMPTQIGRCEPGSCKILQLARVLRLVCSHRTLVGGNSAYTNYASGA